jgi:DNA mismatch endonuclease (patch repair protein)
VEVCVEKALRKKLPNGNFSDTSPAHSNIMKAVRGKGNRTTEARLRAALTRAGISGWRMNVRNVPGKPDFYFENQNLAVFVDGCFWHGCPRCGHLPRKNSAFWREKISRNTKRDQVTCQKLRRQGIRVLRFWEHDIGATLSSCISEIRFRLNKQSDKK